MACCNKIIMHKLLQNGSNKNFLRTHLVLPPRCFMQTKAAPAPAGLRMRAWQSNGYDGVGGVALVGARVPPLVRPGDVLVRVQAASVNPLDTAMISGYGRDVLNLMRAAGRAEQGVLDTNVPEFPLTVGRDFAGEVVGVGMGVGGVSVGDQVWGVVSPQRHGSHAEYVVAAASNVCRRPDNVSAVEAASVPYAGLTAWSAVVVSGMVMRTTAPRKRVLLIGASGGVGTLACQLLSAWGAQVVAVCSEDAIDLVSGLGAVEVFDYRNPVTKEILLADKSFDLVVNAAGPDDVDYIEALRPWTGASYVTLSPPFLRNIDEKGLVQGLFKSLRQVVCRNSQSLSEGRAYKWAFYMPNPWAMEELTAMVAKQQIRPVIDKVFPYEAAPEAYQHCLNGHARGKTVISMEPV